MRSSSTESGSGASHFPDGASPPRLSGSMLAARRRHSFRQIATRRVRSLEAARAFVDQVGFCSTFYVFPEGVACLWEAVAGRRRPRWPRHSHHDPDVGLTWTLKDQLPARRHVFYGKLLKWHPILVALDLFPAFYALVRGRQRARDYECEYEAGRLSLTARRIMAALGRESPQYTRGLRAECFMLEPAKTHEFDRAMAELQRGLWIAKTEERYEPSFSYRWDLLEHWLPREVAEGRRLSRERALDCLVTRYLRGAVFSNGALLARLFAVPPAEIDGALARLERAGIIRRPPIAGHRRGLIVSGS